MLLLPNDMSKLFGDTMNTAARIESTGTPGRIHISRETADLVAKAGKEYMIEKRSDPVSLKGKGATQTYWLKQRSTPTGDRFSVLHNLPLMSEPSETGNSEDFNETDRLVDWNVETLFGLLKEMYAKRSKSNMPCQNGNKPCIPRQNSGFLGEVKEIIELPEFNGEQPDVGGCESQTIPEAVHVQLRWYVSRIADMVSGLFRLGGILSDAELLSRSTRRIISTTLLTQAT